MTYERVAVISDVHGNAPALEAVLAEIAALDVDLIVSCGDLLAGPLPVETAALLEPLGDRVRYVRGNADREVAHIYDGGTSPFAGRRTAAAVIGPRERALLDTFAVTVLIHVDGLGDVCCCHGTPTSDETILTYLTSDERLAAELAGAPAPTVIGGHTHMQVDRRVGDLRYVNAGSVGMPYEGTPGPTGRCSGRTSNTAGRRTTPPPRSPRCAPPGRRTRPRRRGLHRHLARARGDRDAVREPRAGGRLTDARAANVSDSVPGREADIRTRTRADPSRQRRAFEPEGTHGRHGS